MEKIYSFETLAKYQRTTRRHVPEDSTLYNDSCENLKSYIILLISWKREYAFQIMWL
jgi:hypothetical protein